jgi:Dolichyl-phosphate-mannose-protein mannosyltransferase
VAQSRGARSESFTWDVSLLLAVGFGLATFVLHMLAAGRYGYQRDELYFISCARHLAWGYVDQPPLIAVVAKVALAVFGDSLYGLRFLPAVAAAATVVVVGRIARRLEGGPLAQGIAMLALALAPFYLAVGNLLTMNAFEPLLWMSAAYLFVKASGSDRPQHWLALGIVVGLGFLNKYSMFFYMGCACIAIALTRERTVFLRRGLWFAVVVAVVLVLPSLVWQAQHGWPQIEVLRNAASDKNVVVSPGAFYLEQLLMMNPLAAPVWLAGLWFLLFAPGGARLRWFGLTYVLLSVLYVAFQAKVYYLAPIYPVLFGAGGVVVERVLAPRRVLAVVYTALILVSGLAIAPEAFPLLPLPAFLAYQNLLDLRDIKMEKHPSGRVPQQFADMLGWPVLTQAMTAAYDALPPAQRTGAAILTHNYGQAAALDFFGPKNGLPPALSGHNNYYLYGTQGFSGDVVLALGLDPVLLRTEWRSVVRVGTFHDDYLLPDQNDVPIYRCTGRIADFAAWWPHTRRYI